MLGCAKGKALPGRGWGWCIGLDQLYLLMDTDLEEKQASGVFMTEDSGAGWSSVLYPPTASGVRAISLSVCISRRYFQVTLPGGSRFPSQRVRERIYNGKPSKFSAQRGVQGPTGLSLGFS